MPVSLTLTYARMKNNLKNQIQTQTSDTHSCPHIHIHTYNSSLSYWQPRMHNNAKDFQCKRWAHARMHTQLLACMCACVYVLAYADTCAPCDPARHLIQHRYARCYVLSVFDMSFIIQLLRAHTQTCTGIHTFVNITILCLVYLYDDRSLEWQIFA